MLIASFTLFFLAVLLAWLGKERVAEIFFLVGFLLSITRFIHVITTTTNISL